MVFTTRYLRNTSPHRRQWIGWLLVAIATVWTPLLLAEEGQEPFIVARLATTLNEGVYLLDLEMQITLDTEPLAALQSGVPLTFLYEFDVEQVRSWLPNTGVASLTQRQQITFHALSNRYLVTNLNSGATNSYPTLRSALSMVGQIEGFPLIDAKFIHDNAIYQVEFRAQLDIEALPAPLRPLAYLTPSWRYLKSDWNAWPLKP